MRPWTISGEGPTQVKTGFATDQEMKAYTSSDFRFTRKGESLYVVSLACPADGTATVHALGLAGAAKGKMIREVDLLGSSQKVNWLQTTDAAHGDLVRSYLVAAGGFGEISISQRNRRGGDPLYAVTARAEKRTGIVL